MKLILLHIYISVLHLILPESEGANRNLDESPKETDHLWNVLGIIVKNCFAKYFGYSVLIGNWTAEENIVLNSIFSDSIPVNLIAINEHDIYEKNQYFRGFFNINETVVNTQGRLANNVTLIVSSTATLIRTLEDLRTSIWWNNEAYFLIVNTNSENGCRNAGEFLKIIWYFKILFTLYFCKNIENRVMIYNFNPFTRIASDFWQIAKDNKENERWTLLEYSFDVSSSFYETHVMRCDNFGFDKTKNLNEYHIRMGTAESLKVTPSKKPRLGFTDYGKQDFKVFDIVLQQMNARATLKWYHSFGFIMNKRPVGFLKDIELDALDLVMVQMFLRDYWKLQTYPFDTNGICIVTRTHPVPFAKRFMSIFTFQVWLCLIGTGFLSIIALKLILKQSITRSMMEVLRIFNSMPTVKTPLDFRGKLFFANVLFLILQVNSFFQSRLSAIETVPDYIPAIHSTDDLLKSHLPTYVQSHHKEFVYHTELRERFRVIPNIHVCLKDLVNKKRVACLTHCDILKVYNYLDDQIYKARNKLLSRPIAFTFMEDWPLASKVNLLLSYVNEGGIYWYHRHKYMKKDKKAYEMEVIDMEQLTFCFYLFFWGCIVSICTLLVEMSLCKLKRLFNNVFTLRSKICQFVMQLITHY